MLDIAFVADLYEFSGHFSTSEDLFLLFKKSRFCIGVLSSKINNCCGCGDWYSFCLFNYLRGAVTANCPKKESIKLLEKVGKGND